MRGQAADFITAISAPIKWVDFLINVEDENKILREKRTVLSLREVESMYNLKSENDELKNTEV